MPGVFISYRREDSSGYAGRLFDILSAHFGRDNTFMDLDTIRGGDNFVTVIEDRIGLCDVLLAVIGERWLTASHDGIRRLDQPDDFVRLEIAKALERGVRVIPVLVGSAAVPREQDLPADLRPLALRHAMDLRDAHFREDAEKLIELLDTTVPAAATPSARPRFFWLAPAATLLIAAVVATGLLLLYHAKHSSPTNTQPIQQQAIPSASSPALSQPATAPSQPAPATSSQSAALPVKPAAATKPATAFPEKAPETPVQLAGTWKATVTYDFANAVYPETFKFEVDGDEISGTASLFEGPRAILDGKIAGNRISFKTRTETELDDKSYWDKHNYKGTVNGDTIEFSMLTESDASEHTPIHFTAHRLGR